MTTNWHRLFGIALMDLLADSPWVVELEKEVTQQQQFLDVLIVRRVAGEFHDRLPDGLENLANHNLLTYKSLHEPLDDWSLKELTHHYVAYRKMVSGKELLAESEFRLYGVCTRFPEKLQAETNLEQIQTGVYRIVRGTDDIRVIVLSEIPLAEHNALWHLFSNRAELVQYGAIHSRESLTQFGVLQGLFGVYHLEGKIMSYTLDDARRDFAEATLSGMPSEKRIELVQKVLTLQERLRVLPAEELLRAIPAETIQAYLQKLQRRHGEDLAPPPAPSNNDLPTE